MRAKGYCDSHYKMWKRGNLPEAPIVTIKGVCRVDGCESKSSWRQLCKSHYEMARKGTLSINLGFPECEIAECKNPQNVQGLCYNHNMARKRYGISKLEYLSMLENAVCGNTGCNSTYRLHIDHDHATGKVRGWLCSDCNTALGLLHDSLEKINGLKKYLEIS